MEDCSASDERLVRKECAFAVIVRDKKILLGQRNYTKKTWKDLSVWTCAGGRAESGEELEETLRREVREETGIGELRILKLLGTVPGAKEGDVTSFFACETGEEPKLAEPEKFSEWRWFSLAEYVGGSAGSFNPHAKKLIVDYLCSLEDQS